MKGNPNAISFEELAFVFLQEDQSWQNSSIMHVAHQAFLASQNGKGKWNSSARKQRFANTSQVNEKNKSRNKNVFANIGRTGCCRSHCTENKVSASLLRLQKFEMVSSLPKLRHLRSMYVTVVFSAKCSVHPFQKMVQLKLRKNCSLFVVMSVVLCKHILLGTIFTSSL